MARGKSICSVLKTIRKQIADANDIKYEPRECHYEGECRGTCPACEAEVRYIERELNIRRQLGKAVAVVGISAGLSALSGCGDKVKKVDHVSEEGSNLTVGSVMVEPVKQLDGDVEYRSPVDTVIVDKDPATGKLLRHITEYSFRNIKPKKFTSLIRALRNSQNGYFLQENTLDGGYVYELRVADTAPNFRTVYIDDDGPNYFRGGVVDNSYNIAKKKVDAKSRHLSKAQNALERMFYSSTSGRYDRYTKLPEESYYNKDQIR